MTVLDAAIERLPHAQLAAPPYERFARAIFGQANWDAHIRYCRWLYQRNPHWTDDERLPVYTCRDGDAIVGQLGIIPAQIVLDGVRQRSGWCVDFFILPSHRRRGLGRQLLTAAHADFPLLMSLGQTDASYNLFLRCGWKPAGTMRTYKRYLRPVRCMTKKTLVSIGIGRFARTRPNAPVQTHVDWPTAEVNAASNTRICRARDFLHWRYSDVPNLSYEFLTQEHNGSRASFAVWRSVSDPPWRRGVLVDLIYPTDLPDAGLTDLLARTADAMRAADVDVFECQTSDHRVLAALPHGPLTTEQPGVRFVFGGIDGAAWPAIPADKWRLYAGDCDLDALHARGDGQ